MGDNGLRTGGHRGYLSLLQGIIELRGVPMAVYTDGHAVFQARRSPPDLSPVSQKVLSTQWGRALGKLGITQIWAHSPEAQGKVERANLLATSKSRALLLRRDQGEMAES